jgi:hypothetical protein
MESRRSPAAATLILIVAFVAQAMGGPGFGTLRRKYIELKTRQPASVRLFNTSIAFTGSSTNREYTPVQESLLATLETELVSNEKTLVKKNSPHEAEWTLSLKVTGFSISNPQQRVETNGKSSTSYTRWSGSLNAAYQVLDRTGHVHDASNVSDAYNKEFNTSGGGGIMGKIPSIHGMGKKPGAPQVVPQTPEDVKQIMIKDVVQQIATQLGNTTKSLQVEVAVGDEHLNRAQEFMDKQLWSRALDEIEKTPAYPKPEEEAYRQYDIGLAYEAMSYDSKNANEQRENIFKAAEYYDKSLELNTKEKYFVESVARTKDAIARFKALDLQNTSQKAPAGGAPKATGKASAAPTVKVGDVIEMYTAGVDQAQIVDIIQNSPVVFDPRDKETVLAMAKAKLPVALQNELRKKAGAAPLGAPAARNASAPRKQQ